jgi:hypothetical protein
MAKGKFAAPEMHIKRKELNKWKGEVIIKYLFFKLPYLTVTSVNLAETVLGSLSEFI